MFKRRRDWSRDDYSDWDSPPKSRRKIALTVVGIAVGLFAIALILLSGPSTKTADDTTASTDNGTRVAADSQSQDAEPMPAIAARKKISAAQCSQRRLQLTADSQSVDRFDLNALDALNKRIGSYNQDCADTNTTAAASSTVGTDATTAAKAGIAQARTDSSSLVDKDDADSDPSGQSPGKQVSGDKSSVISKTGARSGQPTASADAALAGPTADKADVPKWNPTVLSIQSLLKKQGFDPGPTDGLMGRRTREAVKAFQTRHGLKPDGLVTLELLEQVLEAHPAASGKSALSPDASNQGSSQKNTLADKKAPVKANLRSDKPTPTKTALAPKSKPATNPGATDSKKLTIESLNDFERQTIQWVCAGRVNDAGSSSYDECLQDQISRGRRVGKPDLSKLNNFERQAITRLCANSRYELGLAAYYECAARQRDSVTSIARRPNVNNLTIEVRGAVRRNCDGLQFTESLPVYYRCVDTQIARAKR